MNIELKKNAEGYTDTTAAATLSKREPGEIWLYMSSFCLILKNHGTFSTVLLLGAERRLNSDVKLVTENATYYTDPRKLTWGHHSKMMGYVGSIGQDDLDYVVEAIEGELGIELHREKTDWPQSALHALDGIESQVQEIQTDREKLLKENEFLRCRLADMTELHAKAVERVNKVSFAKLKVENQLELLQSMVGSVLARFQVDTEED